MEKRAKRKRIDIEKSFGEEAMAMVANALLYLCVMWNCDDTKYIEEARKGDLLVFYAAKKKKKIQLN